MEVYAGIQDLMFLSIGDRDLGLQSILTRGVRPHLEVKVKSGSEVAQLCLTLSDPMDCSPPGSSAHGIFQERVLEWDAILNAMKPNAPLTPQSLPH